MVLETFMKFYVIFWENAFCLQNWGNGPKIGLKYIFLNLKKNLVINFYWNCSIVKIHIICCFPVQVLYLRKSFFLRCQNALSQSDSRIFKSITCPEQINETSSLYACWYKFTEIKSWLKPFWSVIVNNGCGKSGLRL